MEGELPEVYSPSPDQIKKLMSAVVYFRIGIDFENGIIPKLESSSGLKIVDTPEGIVLWDMEEHLHDEDGQSGHDVDQEEKKESGHTGKDPHIWVNPENVKIQGRNHCRYPEIRQATSGMKQFLPITTATPSAEETGDFIFLILDKKILIRYWFCQSAIEIAML